MKKRMLHELNISIRDEQGDLKSIKNILFEILEKFREI